MNRALFFLPMMFQLKPKDLQRLEQGANIWLATVRPNGKPHLVPIWFVWVDNKAYICTSSRSIKARNIAVNSNVVFALEDGNDPLVVEGEARLVEEIPQAVAAAFLRKYGWAIQGDQVYNALIEINPRRVVL